MNFRYPDFCYVDILICPLHLFSFLARFYEACALCRRKNWPSYFRSIFGTRYRAPPTPLARGPLCGLRTDGPHREACVQASPRGPWAWRAGSLPTARPRGWAAGRTRHIHPPPTHLSWRPWEHLVSFHNCCHVKRSSTIFCWNISY